MEDSRIALPIGVNLDRFIKKNENEFKGASGELSQILRDLALASKVVNRELNKAGLVSIAGDAGSQNAQGDHQQKLDILTDIRFLRALTKGGEICAVISEEQDEMTDTGKHNAKYIVAIDPLDGSSNIDVNVSVGTIFSVYRRISPVGTPPTKEDCLQNGTNQVAAGYIVYGSSTMLVYTTGYGVNGFTYDASLGEYFLSHPNMKIPENGKIYACNEGNYNSFPEGVKRYLTECKEKEMTGRYIGSLVADFHRNLLKGGIYLYPTYRKGPEGKLRLMYECNALAFLAEQAGGLASDGFQRIMQIEPTYFHQKCAFYIGSKNMVETVINYLSEK